MAEESGQDKSLNELRKEIGHSRDLLARDISGLRYELDFPLKIRQSFQRQTVIWIAAAVVIGVALAVMPARTKEIRVNTRGRSKGKRQQEGVLGASIALGALKLATTLLKPVVVGFVRKKMREMSSTPHSGRKW